MSFYYVLGIFLGLRDMVVYIIEIIIFMGMRFIGRVNKKMVNRVACY